MFRWSWPGRVLSQLIQPPWPPPFRVTGSRTPAWVAANEHPAQHGPFGPDLGNGTIRARSPERPTLTGIGLSDEGVKTCERGTTTITRDDAAS